MTHGRSRKPRPPLKPATLDELALHYVGRFATTRAKLRTYLARKLRERGWAEGVPAADLDALVARFARSGLVDDGAYALAKAQSLGRRGYGEGRIRTALHIAGVDAKDRGAALGEAQAGAIAAALRFAERRKLGPFAVEKVSDRAVRQKQLAAMVRAGHPFAVALAILGLEPGATPDLTELTERYSHTDE